MAEGEEENPRKDSAQKRAMKSSFIHTVSSYVIINLMYVFNTFGSFYCL